MTINKQSLLENRLLRYLFSGFTAAAVDYIIYELLVLLVFQSADWVALSASIAGVAGIFVAYFLHSRITWRDRNPGKYGLLKLFAYNIVVMIGLRPLLATILGWLTGLYEWAFSIVQWLGLPFSYDFVASTGIYLLMTIIVAAINYFFYDWVVFGKNSKTSDTHE